MNSSSPDETVSAERSCLQHDVQIELNRYLEAQANAISNVCRQRRIAPKLNPLVLVKIKVERIGKVA